MKPMLRFRMRPFGMTSEFDVMSAARQYTMAGIAERITCPMLITDPEHETFWPGQARQLFEALRCPKTLVPFTVAEGADLHCEPKAAGLREQRIFDWLDQVLHAGR
jgi:alpha-beta hydrolase superfamily lysophospholipase